MMATMTAKHDDNAKMLPDSEQKKLGSKEADRSKLRAIEIDS